MPWFPAVLLVGAVHSTADWLKLHHFSESVLNRVSSTHIGTHSIVLNILDIRSVMLNTVSLGFCALTPSWCPLTFVVFLQILSSNYRILSLFSYFPPYSGELIYPPGSTCLWYAGESKFMSSSNLSPMDKTGILKCLLAISIWMSPRQLILNVVIITPISTCHGFWVLISDSVTMIYLAAEATEYLPLILTLLSLHQNVSY